MMPVSEQDLEVLEAYLDDALSEAEVTDLRRRLAELPELAAAMDQVRAQRQTRQAMWQGMEPDDAAVERLVQRITASVHRHQRWAYVLRRWQLPTAAAACIIVGFLLGWLGRGGPRGDEVVGGGPTIPGVHFINQGSNQRSMVEPEERGSGPFAVAVQDPSGRVVAVQRFQTREEAQRFVESLSRSRSVQNAPPSSQVAP